MVQRTCDITGNELADYFAKIGNKLNMQTYQLAPNTDHTRPNNNKLLPSGMGRTLDKQKGCETHEENADETRTKTQEW